jgi:PPOX class probable F420-dependent enzyme
MNSIPVTHHDLLLDESKAFAFLATIMPNGTPQVTPVWFNTKNQHILINSAKGRIKDLNMRAHPQVAIAIIKPDEPYRYIQIRGKVEVITEENADAHIHALSRKYVGRDFNIPPGQIRVIYKIRPQNVNAMG